MADGANKDVQVQLGERALRILVQAQVMATRSHCAITLNWRNTPFTLTPGEKLSTRPVEIRTLFSAIGLPINGLSSTSPVRADTNNVRNELTAHIAGFEKVPATDSDKLPEEMLQREIIDFNVIRDIRGQHITAIHLQPLGKDKREFVLEDPENSNVNVPSGLEAFTHAYQAERGAIYQAWNAEMLAKFEGLHALVKDGADKDVGLESLAKLSLALPEMVKETEQFKAEHDDAPAMPIAAALQQLVDKIAEQQPRNFPLRFALFAVEAAFRRDEVVTPDALLQAWQAGETLAAITSPQDLAEAAKAAMGWLERNEASPLIPDVTGELVRATEGLKPGNVQEGDAMYAALTHLQESLRTLTVPGFDLATQENRNKMKGILVEAEGITTLAQQRMNDAVSAIQQRLAAAIADSLQEGGSEERGIMVWLAEEIGAVSERRKNPAARDSIADAALRKELDTIPPQTHSFLHAQIRDMIAYLKTGNPSDILDLLPGIRLAFYEMNCNRARLSPPAVGSPDPRVNGGSLQGPVQGGKNPVVSSVVSSDERAGVDDFVAKYADTGGTGSHANGGVKPLPILSGPAAYGF